MTSSSNINHHSGLTLVVVMAADYSDDESERLMNVRIRQWWGKRGKTLNMNKLKPRETFKNNFNLTFKAAERWSWQEMCVTVLGLDGVQLIRTTDISIDGPKKLQQEIMSEQCVDREWNKTLLWKMNFKLLHAKKLSFLTSRCAQSSNFISN